MVQRGQQKVLVSATLENKKENAYNTSLSLSFSRNLHLASFTPQVPLGEGFWEELEKKEEEDWSIILNYKGSLEKGSGFRSCGQESSCSPSSSHCPYFSALRRTGQ